MLNLNRYIDNWCTWISFEASHIDPASPPVQLNQEKICRSRTCGLLLCLGCLRRHHGLALPQHPQILRDLTSTLVIARASEKSQVRHCLDQQGPTISCTKIQTLPNLSLFTTSGYRRRRHRRRRLRRSLQRVERIWVDGSLTRLVQWSLILWAVKTIEDRFLSGS